MDFERREASEEVTDQLDDLVDLYDYPIDWDQFFQDCDLYLYNYYKDYKEKE